MNVGNNLDFRGGVQTVLEERMQGTFWTLIATKKVLDKIGLSASPTPAAVQLSDDDHPLLVYRALNAQLAIKVARAEMRAIEVIRSGDGRQRARGRRECPQAPHQ